jgi:AcrR family transcriptional regulator
MKLNEGSQEAAPQKDSRRARQAMQTRQEILQAARKLFAEKGYAATSVAEIAVAAGASVQTIYDSVGSKAKLVSSLNDLIDQEGGVAPLAARIPTEIDPLAVLDIAVSITHNICERCGDIIGAVYGAANAEPALAGVRDESRRRHREGIGSLTRRLAHLGALRPDVALDRSADMIAALTDPQVVRTFVLDYGWAWDDWHAWTVDTLARLVLAEAGGNGAAPLRDHPLEQ